eukprot:362436-Chlamydomonas_euryale.AAC.1
MTWNCCSHDLGDVALVSLWACVQQQLKIWPLSFCTCALESCCACVMQVVRNNPTPWPGTSPAVVAWPVNAEQVWHAGCVDGQEPTTGRSEPSQSEKQPCVSSFDVAPSAAQVWNSTQLCAYGLLTSRAPNPKAHHSSAAQPHGAMRHMASFPFFHPPSPTHPSTSKLRVAAPFAQYGLYCMTGAVSELSSGGEFHQHTCTPVACQPSTGMPEYGPLPEAVSHRHCTTTPTTTIMPPLTAHCDRCTRLHKHPRQVRPLPAPHQTPPAGGCPHSYPTASTPNPCRVHTLVPAAPTLNPCRVHALITAVSTLDSCRVRRSLLQYALRPTIGCAWLLPAQVTTCSGVTPAGSREPQACLYAHR